MLKPLLSSAVFILTVYSGAKAERLNCPAVPLVAVDPKNQEAIWGVQPGILTSLEFSPGRLVCRYGTTSMSLQLTPKRCAVQAIGGSVSDRGERTVCTIVPGSRASIENQCFLECS